MQQKPDIEQTTHQHDESEFNPNQTPADLAMAQKHLKAKSIGQVKNIKAINPEDICKCCGNIIDKQKIEVNIDLAQLGFLGSGVSLYFFFIKYCIIFLAIIGVVSSIFNIQHNKLGNTCEMLPDCNPDSFTNIYSIINRDHPKDLFDTTAGLNLFTTVVLIVASMILRKKMKNLNKIIDLDNVTPSDFTVMISNLKPGTTEQQITQYLKQKMKSYGEISIIKVVFAYNISEYIDLKRLHQTVSLKQIQEKARLEAKQEENSQELTDLTEQAERLHKSIDDIEANLKGDKFTSSGTVFVTFASDNTAEQVVEVLKNGLISTIWKNLTGIGTLNGYVITVKRAPEPTDIFWENLCYTFLDRLKNKCITYFLTAVLLTSCFFIIFAISQAQNNISSSNKNDPVIVFLSFLASLCLFIINNGIGIIIKKFALFEKHATLTHYFIGVAEKSGIAQFLNTTIIVYIIKKIKWDSEIYASGGLLATISFIVLMNFFSAFNVFLNPFYFMKLWNRRKLLNGNTAFISKTPQYKAHEYFEGNKFDFPQSFAKHIKVIMFASFYSYAAPLVVFCSIFIIIVSYWVDKYHLIRRCSTPENVSQQLPNSMADFYLEFMIVIFCIGNMVFEKLLYDKVSGYTVASLILAIIYWVLDFESITDSLCPFYKKNFTIKRYQQYSYQFLTDYERSNPITAMKAIEEWQKKLQDSKIQPKGKKEQNSYSILSNYALNRPGMQMYAPQGMFGFQQPQFRPMNNNFSMQQPMQVQRNMAMPQLPQGMMPQFQNPLFPQQQFGRFQVPNRIQVYPQNQQSFNMDPSILQNELNTLQTMQQTLQNQLTQLIHPQLALQIMNQLERNKQRIDFLSTQIQQQNLNTSHKNPLQIIPAIGATSNLANPLLQDNGPTNLQINKDKHVFLNPQQQVLPNPLIINQINPNSNQVPQGNNPIVPSQNNSQIINPQSNNPIVIPQSNNSQMMYPQNNNNQIINPLGNNGMMNQMGIQQDRTMNSNFQMNGQLNMQQQPQQIQGIQQYPMQMVQNMGMNTQLNGMQNMQNNLINNNQYQFQQQQNYQGYMQKPGIISMIPTQQQGYYQQNQQMPH